MKTKFFGMFWAMLAVVVLTGCDNDDDDIRVSDVPKEVMNTFEAKFPNVSRAEWENKLGYYVADFWQEGMETHVWIDNKAEWKMTEKDCLNYCYESGYDWNENGIELYSVLDRVSCWCCQNKNLKELKNIYLYLPEYWQRLRGLQSRIQEPMKGKGKSVFELEERFKREGEQLKF